MKTETSINQQPTKINLQKTNYKSTITLIGIYIIVTDNVIDDKELQVIPVVHLGYINFKIINIT